MGKITKLFFATYDEFFDSTLNFRVVQHCLDSDLTKRRARFCVKNATRMRNVFYGPRGPGDEDNDWLNKYNDTVFYQFFRMNKETYDRLLHVLIEADIHGLIKKKYRDGNCPINPEMGLLIFLWYMANQDALQCIGYNFRVSTSTVMQIVNVFLYIILGLKNKYIFWPRSEQEYRTVSSGFQKYPGALGAIDGSHVDLKVPVAQHDSYVDRYQGHSINLLGICNASKIFTYIFVGYPGSAHDSRVFPNSGFVRNLQTHGREYYFPAMNYHIIGDSAFPIRDWLMTPYRRNQHLGRLETHHNFLLSSDRIVIENIFGIVKGRWRRLFFINTYSISKAIEITTAACILHNFCYTNNDEWTGNVYQEERRVRHFNFEENNIEDARLGREKRDNIARVLFANQ